MQSGSDRYILSCYHVLANKHPADIGADLARGAKMTAVYTTGIAQIDAAIGKLNSNVVASNYLAKESTYPSAKIDHVIPIHELMPGTSVLLYGAKTKKPMEGDITDWNIAMSLAKGVFNSTVSGLIQIVLTSTDSSQGGDSGGPVFQLRSETSAGIAGIIVGSTQAGKTVLFTPVDMILTRFQQELGLHLFLM